MTALIRRILAWLRKTAPQSAPEPSPVSVPSPEPKDAPAAPAVQPLGHDEDIAARTLWGEARGEPVAGQLAVAHVLWNRARIASEWKARGRRHPLFGDGTLAGVCLAPWQFSCWNANDPNRPKMEALTAKQLEPFIAIVRRARHEPDPTKGSTHYHTKAVSPAWSRGLTPAAVIGAHMFFNNVP